MVLTKSRVLPEVLTSDFKAPTLPFPKFGKMPRWWKNFVITEKIDGTNGLIQIWDENDVPFNAPVLSQDFLTLRYIAAGSRNRWLGLGSDNYGFARWVWDNSDRAAQLGPGVHYGEWYGSGINRGYNLEKGEKRFALFNSYRWRESRPSGFDVVPVLWQGSGDDLHDGIDYALELLIEQGSRIAPGFMNPEGIVIYSVENGTYWKKYLDEDRTPKGEAA
jgi:RNA ligase